VLDRIGAAHAHLAVPINAGRAIGAR